MSVTHTGQSRSSISRPSDPIYPAWAYNCFAVVARRLLGLGRDAGFEEVQDARNYLYELYRWHEPSREAIELAFDSIIQVRTGKQSGTGPCGTAIRPNSHLNILLRCVDTQEKLKVRHKFGFQPIRLGRRGDVFGAAKASWEKKIYDLVDPTITVRTLINEGSVFIALALW